MKHEILDQCLWMPTYSTFWTKSPGMILTKCSKQGWKEYSSPHTNFQLQRDCKRWVLLTFTHLETFLCIGLGMFHVLVFSSDARRSTRKSEPNLANASSFKSKKGRSFFSFFGSGNRNVWQRWQELCLHWHYIRRCETGLCATKIKCQKWKERKSIVELLLTNKSESEWLVRPNEAGPTWTRSFVFAQQMFLLFPRIVS